MDFNKAFVLNVLSEYSLSPTKKFGQNFLIDKRTREKIVSLAEMEEGMRVWEIGPGLGALTFEILKKNVSLTAFEIDRGFCLFLKDHFKDTLSLVEGDALKTLTKQKRTPDRVISNLPYNVASEIIGTLIEEEILAPLMVFTVQKEVAERITAEACSASYSSFSVLASIDYNSKIALKIPPSSFFPEPKVDSAVVVMERKESLIKKEERKGFIHLTRTLFSKRRKTIRNNLLSLYDKDSVEKAISKAQLKGSERAETLSPFHILSLFHALKTEL